MSRRILSLIMALALLVGVLAIPAGAADDSAAGDKTIRAELTDTGTSDAADSEGAASEDPKEDDSDAPSEGAGESEGEKSSEDADDGNEDDKDEQEDEDEDEDEEEDEEEDEDEPDLTACVDTSASWTIGSSDEKETYEVTCDDESVFEAEFVKKSPVIIDGKTVYITEYALTFSKTGTYTVTFTGSDDEEPLEITVKVIDHDYKLMESEDATCVEDGFKTYTCDNCGDTYTEEIPALSEDGEHTYDEGEVTAKATCLEPGEMTYTCKVCGETYVEEIPALSEDGEHTPKDEGVVLT